MAFRVTNEFVGQTTLDAAQLDQNFTDVEAKFAGGITTADLSPVAGITNGQLANSQYDFFVTASITNGTVAAQPPVDNLTPIAVIGLPGPDLVTGNWSVEETQYFMNDVGPFAENMTIRSEVGKIVGTNPGVFTSLTIPAPIVLPVFIGDNGGVGATGSEGFVLGQAANPVVPDQSQEPLFLGLFITAYSTVGVGGIFNTAGTTLSVTYRIRRVGGLNQ